MSPSVQDWTWYESLGSGCLRSIQAKEKSELTSLDWLSSPTLGPHCPTDRMAVLTKAGYRTEHEEASLRVCRSGWGVVVEVGPCLFGLLWPSSVHEVARRRKHADRRAADAWAGSSSEAAHQTSRRLTSSQGTFRLRSYAEDDHLEVGKGTRDETESGQLR